MPASSKAADHASLPTAAIPQQRPRSATPTAASNFGDNMTAYKSTIQQPSEQQLDAYPAVFSSSDRQNLIERLKRSHSPTWQRSGGTISSFNRSSTSRNGSVPGNLLPPINLDSDQVSMDVEHDSQNITEALLNNDLSENSRPETIPKDDYQKTNQFPRAFHDDLSRIEQTDPFQRSIPDRTSWYQPLSFPPEQLKPKSPSIDIPGTNRTPPRRRAPSSSSFVSRPPTSPLVHDSNNEDLDLSPIDLAASPTKISNSNRRHTLPPQTHRQSMTLAQAARQPPSLQRDHSVPVYSHHVRRSYTGLSIPASPSPSTPSHLRTRRSSFASEISPVQASMVGSYEESIIRGRMSTTPSKPLDFTASIGALGRGECKPKYPAHVSVDFPAVYYSWNASNGGSISDEPAPYVGQIDLEHKLNAPVQKEKVKRRRETLADQTELRDSSVKSREAKRQEKRRKRSQSPSAALQSFGGCYRIPQQGQLQILIKNPHKTAVKLFLVPYDLEGMQPRTKTFVRQRSHSIGPVVEQPLTSRSLSDSVIETKQKVAAIKPVLRYLVQLNICCPAQGRYYLYKTINVVFANRVPDDKEKLQTETLWPEPKYSPWKPSNSESGTSTPRRRQSVDWDMRRRSYTGAHLDTDSMDTMDDIPTYSRTSTTNNSFEPFGMDQAYDRSVRSSLLAKDLDTGLYAKLNRGEMGYGGRPATPESVTGLLAKRLKGLSNEINEQDSIGGEGMELA